MQLRDDNRVPQYREYCGQTSLLGSSGRLYLTILECKQSRERWIRRLSLQTRDPASE